MDNKYTQLKIEESFQSACKKENPPKITEKDSETKTHQIETNHEKNTYNKTLGVRPSCNEFVNKTLNELNIELANLKVIYF